MQMCHAEVNQHAQRTIAAVDKDLLQSSCIDARQVHEVNKMRSSEANKLMFHDTSSAGFLCERYWQQIQSISESISSMQLWSSNEW